MSSLQLTLVRTQRTFEAISDQIRDQIRTGALRTGDRLPNERELANTLGVSRHAVREALRALESVGLVELRKGASGGAFISRGRPDVITDAMRDMFHVGGISLEQLTETRLLLESAIVRLACERADPRAFDALEDNVRRAEAETQAGNLAAKTALNIEFHTLLAAATGNPLLAMLTGAVMNVLREFVGHVGSVMGADVIRSRRRLLKHMRAGNADAAVAEMTRHLKVLDRHYRDAAALLKTAKIKPERTHGAKQ
jgi:DNA-binding FadR family transcriptional regulator